MSYYERQLKRVIDQESDDSLTVVFNKGLIKSNCLTVNAESLPIIIAELQALLKEGIK